jgi:Nickel responsive protein SCO4226-like
VAKFMDIHGGFFGVTARQQAEAHQFCLATGPSKEAMMRVHERAGHPTPEVYEVPIEVA